MWVKAPIMCGNVVSVSCGICKLWGKHASGATQYFCILSLHRRSFKGNWQNRVYLGGFWTKSITFFFATGRAYARLQNASKTRSGAWTHYALCARSTPNRFFGVRPLKTAPMTAPKKCSPRTTRFCSGTHRVYPALCFDFMKHPILFILHPILFIPHNGRSFTQLASCRLWRLWCSRSSTANFPAHKDPPWLMNNLPPRWNRTAKHGCMAVGKRGHPTKIRR